MQIFQKVTGKSDVWRTACYYSNSQDMYRCTSWLSGTGLMSEASIMHLGRDISAAPPHSCTDLSGLPIPSLPIYNPNSAVIQSLLWPPLIYH